MPRYEMAYGDRGGYVVKDTHNRPRNPSSGRRKPAPIVFKSESKSTTIAKAQELNGFKPIDGDERTYGRQIAEAALRIGR